MPDDEEFLASARENMVSTQIAGRRIRDLGVLESMRETPRHLFVPEELVWLDGEQVPVDSLPPDERRRLSGTGSAVREKAYADRALPIGWGQTISQPYMVGYMTECLQLEPSDTVLEIGTGCGYQTAVLAPLVQWVYTVEIVEPLARRASALLEALGVENVSPRIGDGHAGWEEHSPFDAIIVTCAPEAPPPALVEQLREGGRMVVPTGRVGASQVLHLFRKHRGSLQEAALIPVAFVPMTGGA